MRKDTTLNTENQLKNLFSLPVLIKGKKVKADFDAPDLSSNGGLALMDKNSCSFLDEIAACIPDYRNQSLILHSHRDMLRQRVGQILCGYEDANDCDYLRDDSALKMMADRLPSDNDLCSQPTMTRLENKVSARTLYKIGVLFVKQFVKSFASSPRRVVLDVDDTNSNTFGTQQLTLFNDYYGEYCYMPLLMFDGMTGKMILPMLRPGRRNKSVNVFGLLRRVVEYLHRCWPSAIIELRGDSHFCSHEFMDWAHDRCYVRFTTGLAGNRALLKQVEKQRRHAENDFNKSGKEIRRYFKLNYRAASWKYEQRVIVKIEVNSQGTNIRFVVTSNRNNKAETIYRRYCGRGIMELWIKDIKYLHGDRMSCHSFRANQLRLFLHSAAYVLIYNTKERLFKHTEIAYFTVDSFIKKIMLSAVHIKEMKSLIKISFTKGHRYRQEMENALSLLASA